MSFLPKLDISDSNSIESNEAVLISSFVRKVIQVFTSIYIRFFMISLFLRIPVFSTVLIDDRDEADSFQNSINKLKIETTCEEWIQIVIELSLLFKFERIRFSWSNRWHAISMHSWLLFPLILLVPTTAKEIFEKSYIQFPYCWVWNSNERNDPRIGDEQDCSCCLDALWLFPYFWSLQIIQYICSLAKDW